MKITRPYGNEIVVVENFINDQELAYLISLTKNIPEGSWKDENGDSAPNWSDRIFSLGKHEKFDPNFFEDLESRAHSFVEQAYNPKEFYLTPMKMLSRASVGQGMDIHHDQAPGDTPLSLYGLILYLNTAGVDFSGGEIYYRDFDIAYSPVAGNLVIHPGGDEYSHGVKEVTDGVRYCMTSFAKG